MQASVPGAAGPEGGAGEAGGAQPQPVPGEGAADVQAAAQGLVSDHPHGARGRPTQMTLTFDPDGLWLAAAVTKMSPEFHGAEEQHRERQPQTDQRAEPLPLFLLFRFIDSKNVVGRQKLPEMFPPTTDLSLGPEVTAAALRCRHT